MTPTLPSLDPFIKYCGEVDSMLRSLNALTSPAFFSRSIYGVTVTAEDAIVKIDSLRRLACKLQQYQTIAEKFETVDPFKFSSPPPDDGQYDTNPTAMTNEERAYVAIAIALEEWKSHGDCASRRMHKNHQLIHIGEEFFCLDAETESLGELFAAGSLVLSDPTSRKAHKAFDKCLRCIFDLHRSEFSKIRKNGIRGGLPFADQKLKLYARFKYGFDSCLLGSGVGLEAGDVQSDPINEMRDTLKGRLAELTELELASARKEALITDLVTLNLKLDQCECEYKLREAVALVGDEYTANDIYCRLVEIGQVFS